MLDLDIIEIRAGLKPGSFSAILPDSRGTQSRAFLAKTCFKIREDKGEINYTFYLKDASLPGVRAFEATERPITSREIAEEASHYLIRKWAESQDFLVDDQTNYAGIKYNSTDKEIDFS